MADPLRASSVYRYFDLADSFVQVHLTGPEQLGSLEGPGLNRADYRRLVLGTCMPSLGDDVDAAVREICPEDPLLATDLLFQLCVEVNPTLDIHEVRLLSGAPTPRVSPEPRAEDSDGTRERLRSRARGLEERLRRRIIGQDSAVQSVCRAVRKAAVGIGDEGRPLASLLFTGRTGTGKTELARVLAEELFGGHPGKLVRVDCSELGMAHEYAKLIGAPPGYVGHEDGGQLTEALRREPECLVLFDEIEKAHPRMHNLLLQVLEEGALTDSRGTRVSFGRSLVLMTSNAGSGEMIAAGRALGFGHSRVLGRGDLQAITDEALTRHFSPEFLGRIDEHLLFGELDLNSARRIAALELAKLALRTRRRGTLVSFTPAVAHWVAQHGYSPEFGVRELRRVIQREIEARVAEVMLEARLSPDQLLRVRVRGSRLDFVMEA